mmetsp:Transcript_82396/g.254692  ORF Transcript_82396/g.254692 Transcript_82396/m.254692 type:complete len:217 (-) Transcript_82396:227-877(-)
MEPKEELCRRVDKTQRVVPQEEQLQQGLVVKLARLLVKCEEAAQHTSQGRRGAHEGPRAEEREALGTNAAAVAAAPAARRPHAARARAREPLAAQGVPADAPRAPVAVGEAPPAVVAGRERCVPGDLVDPGQGASAPHWQTPVMWEGPAVHLASVDHGPLASGSSCHRPRKPAICCHEFGERPLEKHVEGVHKDDGGVGGEFPNSPSQKHMLLHHH